MRHRVLASLPCACSLPVPGKESLSQARAEQCGHLSLFSLSLQSEREQVSPRQLRPGALTPPPVPGAAPRFPQQLQPAGRGGVPCSPASSEGPTARPVPQFPSERTSAAAALHGIGTTAGTVVPDTSRLQPTPAGTAHPPGTAFPPALAHGAHGHAAAPGRICTAHQTAAAAAAARIPRVVQAYESRGCWEYGHQHGTEPLGAPVVVFALSEC